MIALSKTDSAQLAQPSREIDSVATPLALHLHPRQRAVFRQDSPAASAHPHKFFMTLHFPLAAARRSL
jgi:hypothetical protein